MEILTAGLQTGSQVGENTKWDGKPAVTARSTRQEPEPEGKEPETQRNEWKHTAVIFNASIHLIELLQPDGNTSRRGNAFSNESRHKTPACWEFEEPLVFHVCELATTEDF